MLPQSDIDAANQAVDDVAAMVERHNAAVGELLTKSLSLPREVSERDWKLAQVEHFVIEALNHLDGHAPGLASAALKRALAVLRKERQ